MSGRWLGSGTHGIQAIYPTSFSFGEHGPSSVTRRRRTSGRRGYAFRLLPLERGDWSDAVYWEHAHATHEARGEPLSVA